MGGSKSADHMPALINIEAVYDETPPFTSFFITIILIRK